MKRTRNDAFDLNDMKITLESKEEIYLKNLSEKIDKNEKIIDELLQEVKFLSAILIEYLIDNKQSEIVREASYIS